MRSFRVFRGKAPDDRRGRDPSRAERQPPEKSKTFWAGGNMPEESAPYRYDFIVPQNFRKFNP